MLSPIIIEKNDQNTIAIVKISRPQMRNALDLPTLHLLEQEISKLEDDENIGVIIITGEGNKAFVSGADIQSLSTRTTLEVFRGDTQRVFTKIEQCRKPVIAAINGVALGGGCELALACDIRIASSNAKFGQPEVNLGIIPGAGGTQRLSKIVGFGRAMELILTGRIVSAEEALSMALISEVVEEGEVINAALRIAKLLLSKGPIAIQLAKLCIHSSANTDLSTGLLIEKLAQMFLFTTDDRIEGTHSYLEKRGPRFSGKW